MNSYVSQFTNLVASLILYYQYLCNDHVLNSLKKFRFSIKGKILQDKVTFCLIYYTELQDYFLFKQSICMITFKIIKFSYNVFFKYYVTWPEIEQFSLGKIFIIIDRSL